MTRPTPELSMKMAREVLGVSSAATPAEVREAFRKAAKRAHPDTGGDEGAFRQVLDAYQRLQDPLDSRFVQPPVRARATPDPDLEITPQLALEGGEVDHRMPDGQIIRITLPAGLRSGDKVRAGGAELCVYIRAHDGGLVRRDHLLIILQLPPSLP